ncbi:hypothetical protein TRIUR3_32579 [Triticum urartu]|uniref:Uncharacterized protein n=1 Tax=Triticum urartu TaxID=4572 RepID=M8AJ92_TRIUA|nr:hypothetical protein TRIUR3_32579 [Triticum urartu]
MEAEDDQPAAGYRHGPPWVFKGRQVPPLLFFSLPFTMDGVGGAGGGRLILLLHLVKAATARAFVPKELRLVEAFGYTLGGMFLARYHDSPAGQFDEVPLPAWPHSISSFLHTFSDELCFAAGGDRRHCVESADFLREVGLPSHVAAFSQDRPKILRSEINQTTSSTFSEWVQASPSKRITGALRSRRPRAHHQGICATSVCLSTVIYNLFYVKCIDPYDLLPLFLNARRFGSSTFRNREGSRGSHKRSKWMGPAIKMSLPSFSGQTEDHPELLKYSCKVECRVRPVSPAKIWSPKTAEPQECSDGMNSSTGSSDSDAQKQSLLVLLSRPILALEFSSLRMHVDAPKIVAPHPKKKEVRYSST